MKKKPTADSFLKYLATYNIASNPLLKKHNKKSMTPICQSSKKDGIYKI